MFAPFPSPPGCSQGDPHELCGEALGWCLQLAPVNIRRLHVTVPAALNCWHLRAWPDATRHAQEEPTGGRELPRHSPSG